MAMAHPHPHISFLGGGPRLSPGYASWRLGLTLRSFLIPSGQVSFSPGSPSCPPSFSSDLSCLLDFPASRVALLSTLCPPGPSCSPHIFLRVARPQPHVLFKICTRPPRLLPCSLSLHPGPPLSPALSPWAELLPEPSVSPSRACAPSDQ